MNTIYGSVQGIEVPAFDWENYDEYTKKCEQYTKQVQAFAKRMGKQNYSGKILRFPVADGFAEYVIVKLLKTGCQLIHLNLNDGYEDANVHYISKEGFIAKIQQDEAWEKAMKQAKARQDNQR